MGQLEKTSAARKKKQDIQKAVLYTIGTAGLIAVAALAPNTLQLLRFTPQYKRNFAFRAHTAAGRLVAKKHAQWVERNGKKYLRLTPAGHEELALEQAKMTLHSPKRKWDGRWRMVVFDIPERRKHVRGRLREIMRGVGFVRLQNSVWVYPYDCEDLVVLLKAHLRVGKDILYVIADSLEYDRTLRTHFGLS